MTERPGQSAVRRGGVIPPVVTPMTPDGDLDVKSLQNQVEWLADRGADGIWINGTTGEFYALSDQEKTIAVRETVSALNGRPCPVIAQVGAPATRLAIKAAEDAVSAGADAICAVVPYYAPFEQHEVKAYLRDLRRAAGVPLYLYQVPVMTKLAAAPAVILDLAEEGTLAGMKDSLGDTSVLRALLEQARARAIELPVFIGDGMLLDTSMLAGAVGAITAIAVVAPRFCTRLVAAAAAGDWGTARQLQSRLAGLLLSLRLPDRAPWTPRTASLKFLLRELGVIASETCAQPFTPLTPTEQEALRTTALPLVEQLESSADAA